MVRDEFHDADSMRHSEEDAVSNDPLMSRASDEQESQEGLRKIIEPLGQTRASLRTAGKVVWLLTVSAGISGLLFGYDTGVISSTLVSIGTDLGRRPLTTTDKSLITAITSLFALLSAPTTGYFADRFGRRFVILLANVLFILGAVLQAAAGYVSMMVVGRAVVGAAVGMASGATPLYISELAPSELRGRLVTIQSLFITGGQVLAYIVGWLLSRWPAGWRWMVGLGAAPAILQFFLLALMFETPRWSMKNGKKQKARFVLQRVYGGLPEQERETRVEGILEDIQAEIAAETKLDTNGLHGDIGTSPGLWTTIKHLVRVPGNRRSLTIACMLQGLQQLCGFNTLMYFSATIFALVGFVYPIGTSLTIAGTNFAFTVMAFAFIDILGRRNILLWSIPFMIVGLAACSLAFLHINVFREGPAWTTVWTGNSHFWPGFLIAAMIVYVAAYAIGLGCVPWQQSELFPLRVRSLGSGIATATNWLSNFIIGVTFLPMMDFLGPSATFFIYALICVIGWVGVWKIYPETAGLELEGIGELLNDGYGVKDSVERFRVGKRSLSKLLANE